MGVDGVADLDRRVAELLARQEIAEVLDGGNTDAASRRDRADPSYRFLEDPAS